MKKIALVAWREFVSTVATKAFIIGALVFPVIIAVMSFALPRLMNEKAPRIVGEVAIADRTGVVADEFAENLSPRALAERRTDLKKQIRDATPEQLQVATGAAEAAGGIDPVSLALGEVPDLAVTRLDTGADLEAEKRALIGRESETERKRLALIVVHDDAVERKQGESSFGTYDMFVREKLDDRVEDEIKGALRSAIVDHRIERLGMDPSDVQALTTVKRVTSTTVTEAGERKTNEILNVLLPVGFMALLLISVMTGGQYLMTTTVEEKTSRVVEVLLSAVSPMQLMTGKILGQMLVGLLMLGLYAGMGVTLLASFAFLGLIDPWLFLYLIIFYAIAYFVVASLMAAIGAAVNEMREAQSLMTPVILMIMIPWMLWLPISRDPNSTFATVISFIPPINTFVMMLRMTSTTPPPLWQVWVTIGIGLASVYGALWFAGKVFRVGLLMHGKPPNFATLIRWVRMA